MKILRNILYISMAVVVLQGCSVSYSFTGAQTLAKTFQVNNFVNNAAIVEPRLAREFTVALQDILLDQTSMSLVTNNGELVYEGEIVQYYVAPITATSQSTAAQNRLTIGINVRYFNTIEPEKDFEQRFSFYYDFGGSSQLVGSQLDDALADIFERLTQDIFNKSLADW